MSNKESLKAEAEELIDGFKKIFYKKIGCEVKVFYTLPGQTADNFKLPLYVAAVDELIVKDPFIKRKQSIRADNISNHVRFYKQAYIACAAEQGYLYKDIVESIGKTYLSYVNASCRVISNAQSRRDPEARLIVRIYDTVRAHLKTLKDADI